jgi:hypothetical protein
LEGDVQTNPYEAPKAPVEPRPAVGLLVEQIASGQKLVIYAILVNLATIGLQVVIGQIAGLLGLASLVMSVVGIVRLGRGMGMAPVSRTFLVIAMFIPLINLITLLVLNSRATTHLRNAGYKVGLLGASK